MIVLTLNIIQLDMNWRHHQKMTEDIEDQQFLEEQGMDQPQQPQDEDEIDPLDAFMNDLNTNNPQIEAPQPSKSQGTTRRDREEQEEDDEEVDQSNNGGNVHGNSEDEILSNEEADAPHAKKQKKAIENLKPFDFSSVQLRDFDKNFYEEHEEIRNLSQQQVRKYMKELEIKVAGADVPRPIVSFGHLNLDDTLNKLIVKNSFERPTPIQAIALPAALSGRDVVGIAKTGSGKTLAYVWPMIVHVSHQEESGKGDGPIAVVMAPTRELCQQIYIESKKYSKKYNLKVACILGGENKHEQWKALKAGVDILIASPGRLIEMIKKKATNLIRVTYLVLDEADRMLSLGFEQQIRSIVSQTREDRQTLLFTATMKQSMQFLVSDIISTPVRINIGEQGAANEDVRQQVVILQQKQQKMGWLQLHLKELLRQGKVLIFANQRQTCQEIGRFIQDFVFLPALVLHGDKNQYERTMIMNAFKADKEILVATDIAARGIDVKNIKTVINFECPKQIEGYIHRIGRAGRAGETGVAYTFLTNYDVKFAIHLVKTFENSGYPVPQQLEDLACLDDFFKRKRLSAKMGVSFAKGKDASKFLTQILNKQRMGYNRAGLGMVDPKSKPVASSGKTSHILSGQKNLDKLSISEISTLIRQKHQKNQNKEQKFGVFVLSSTGPMTQDSKEATITFARPLHKQ